MRHVHSTQLSGLIQRKARLTASNFAPKTKSISLWMALKSLTSILPKQAEEIRERHQTEETREEGARLTHNSRGMPGDLHY